MTTEKKMDETTIPYSFEAMCIQHIFVEHGIEVQPLLKRVATLPGTTRGLASILPDVPLFSGQFFVLADAFFRDCRQSEAGRAWLVELHDLIESVHCPVLQEGLSIFKGEGYVGEELWTLIMTAERGKQLTDRQISR